MKLDKISTNRFSKPKIQNKIDNKLKTPRFQIVEKLVLPLKEPVWYPITVESGQTISVRAIVEYLNINLTNKRKAVLLIRAYDDAGNEVEVSFHRMAKSETFKAHFKYLGTTQSMVEDLYTLVVPERVKSIHFGFVRFLCSEDEQVILNDLIIQPKLVELNEKSCIPDIKDNFLMEKLVLPLKEPVWYPITVESGQTISVRAIVEYLNINLTNKRKAVLLIRAYDDAGNEVEVSFHRMAKSETFKAHFKYLGTTQSMVEDLYTLVVPERVKSIHFGFVRFLCSEDEQVTLNDLNIQFQTKNETDKNYHKPSLNLLQDTFVEPANNIQNASVATANITINTDRYEPLKYLKDLRISTIMDEFTYESYKEECNINQLSIYSWEKQLDDFKPDILFVESAWRGFNDEWDRKISNSSPELEGIIDWCNRKNIPTVFWNKEDPVHFQTFINIAKKFGTVFTTDVDCIERYKSILKHDNIYWLPFAAQLSVNNPIEKYERKDAFCFAGAYYVKYPARTKDLNNFIKCFSKVKPFVIYDRNYYKNDENYSFPPQFEFFIEGNLPFEEIDKAYKGYDYTVNLNSVKQSQSMFARRVYEALASNTILVSNYSRGLRTIFGDLVLSSDSPKQILKELQPLLDDKLLKSSFKLLGLRKVLSEHTYTHRLDHIVNKVLDINLTSKSKVYVFSVARNEKDLAVIIDNYSKQIYKIKELIILDTSKSIQNSNKYTLLYSLEELKVFTRQIDNTDFISYFSNYDYYGKYYLYDLVLATKFSSGKVVGKSSYFKATDNNLIELHENKTYVMDKELRLKSSLMPKNTFLKLFNLNDDFESINISSDTVAVDYFNYCRDYYKFSFENEPLDLICTSDINIGLKVEDFNNLVSKTIEEGSEENIDFISASELYSYFPKVKSKHFILNYCDHSIVIKSDLESNKHTYQYIAEPINISDFSLKAGELQKIYFDIDAGLNLQLVFKYLDSNKNSISHSMIYGMRNTTLQIPLDCHFISIGLRIYGSGETVINKILWGHRINDPAFIVSDKEHLLVTNHYPSYYDLYRNGFVHSRVLSYQEKNAEVEVFKLRKNENVSYDEFEGVDITVGSNNALEKMIENNNFKTILVHFLDQNIWDTLSKYVHDHKIIVWVHGAEIQSWHRRAFNYSNESQALEAKNSYYARASFWRNIINDIPDNLHFIFVSEYFVDEIMKDLNVVIPSNHYEVIANPIDTDKFIYRKKDIELRKKILSIRPYASKTYANDLTVKAILELSKEEFFENLEFRIIGDGVLFEETLEPLRNFKNVIIEQKFLSQDEIAAMHKDYGIFLCPSRMDTQGVSRDEAMSSGLVPITNAVGAIPEFLIDFKDLLTPAEDYLGLAKIIKDLYYNPNYFSELSEKVSKSIETRKKELIVMNELKIINTI